MASAPLCLQFLELLHGWLFVLSAVGLGRFLRDAALTALRNETRPPTGRSNPPPPPTFSGAWPGLERDGWVQRRLPRPMDDQNANVDFGVCLSVPQFAREECL